MNNLQYRIKKKAIQDIPDKQMCYRNNQILIYDSTQNSLLKKKIIKKIKKFKRLLKDYLFTMDMNPPLCFAGNGQIKHDYKGLLYFLFSS